jgi:acyl-CoA synthetase (AMP-forming)/AMP-acid ligase II
MRESIQRQSNIVHTTIDSLPRMRAEQQPSHVAYTFVPDSSGAQEVTYSQLDRRARVIGRMLADLGIRGKSAMLLYPPGIDYIAAFFGCMCAGVIAVPACPPDPMRLDRSLPRLAAVVRAAMPSAVLTTASIGAALGLRSRSSPELSLLCIITTDDACPDLAQGWEPALAAKAEVAAPASLPERAAADQDSVRLYRWAGGSRVPVHAALSLDPVPAGRRPGERPRWAS